MWGTWRAWTLACLLVAGCDGGGVTLLVELRTDLVPGFEVASVTTVLEGEGVERVTSVRVGDDLLAGVRVAELEGLAPRVRDVRVELRRVDGTIAAQRVVRVDHRSDRGVTVVIARDCVAVVCPGVGDDPAAVSCVGGRCEAPECVNGDEAACGDAECTTGSDCPSLDPCSTPECVGSICTYAADDASCGAGEFCRPEDGCTPIPGASPDAGGRDAGTDAGTDAGGYDAGSCVPCQLVSPQCGCPAGQMCTWPSPTTSDDRVCRPIGAAGTGEACAVHEDCTTGHICLNIAGEGQCLEFCDSSADCVDESVCISIGTGTPVGGCSIPCNPATNTGCGPGLVCTAATVRDFPSGTNTWWTLCVPPGGLAEGDTCSGGGCGPGLVCTNTKCIHFCDTAAPVCATGMCVAITTPEFRQGPRTYGLCYERP
ncbi:MAG: hypothetical protein H6719_23415 [Sandaracinaceae bacterium]|nr:hypothetical protein [Sandaracinaceae bacterium]